MSRKANRKSQKPFPFVKMVGNHGSVVIHTFKAPEIKLADSANSIYLDEVDY